MDWVMVTIVGKSGQRHYAGTTYYIVAPLGINAIKRYGLECSYNSTLALTNSLRDQSVYWGAFSNLANTVQRLLTHWFTPLHIARYVSVQLSELMHRGENKIIQRLKQQQTDLNLVSRFECVSGLSVYWPIIALGTRECGVSKLCRDPAVQSEFFLRGSLLKTFNLIYCHR